jgi:uncharacterized protein (DUF427 family)
MRNRVEPGPGQESVWDYPRPPRLEDSHRHVRIELNGVVVAETRRSKRVLETSHPPVYYVPPEDVRPEVQLVIGERQTYCEWKGVASYYTVKVGELEVTDAAWVYLNPTPPYASLRGYLAFYPGKMDLCTVDGEPVRPQPGHFYGGWVTADIVGPFKGEPGTEGW